MDLEMKNYILFIVYNQIKFDNFAWKIGFSFCTSKINKPKNLLIPKNLPTLMFKPLNKEKTKKLKN